MPVINKSSDVAQSRTMVDTKTKNVIKISKGSNVYEWLPFMSADIQECSGIEWSNEQTQLSFTVKDEPLVLHVWHVEGDTEFDIVDCTETKTDNTINGVLMYYENECLPDQGVAVKDCGEDMLTINLTQLPTYITLPFANASYMFQNNTGTRLYVSTSLKMFKSDFTPPSRLSNICNEPCDC